MPAQIKQGTVGQSSHVPLWALNPYPLVTVPLQEVQMKFTDGRIKLMNEILGGIKILKFYAWEKAFKDRVLEQRESELRALKRSQILYSISIASFNSSSFLVWHPLNTSCGLYARGFQTGFGTHWWVVTGTMTGHEE